MASRYSIVAIMTSSYDEDAGSTPAIGSTCKTCDGPISKYGKVYCSQSCAAKLSNRARAADKGACLVCALPIEPYRRFCSKKCCGAERRRVIIDDWLAGKISGVNTNGVVIPLVKNWLRSNRGDRCEICGWCQVSPTTGIVPVVADHIDGNWQNNRPENLRLLCPNCDSLQATYQGQNRGNGRTMRK